MILNSEVVEFSIVLDEVKLVVLLLDEEDNRRLALNDVSFSDNIFEESFKFYILDREHGTDFELERLWCV